MNLLSRRFYTIALSDVLVNGKSVQQRISGKAGHYFLSLDDSQKSVTIQFSALTYSDPNSLMYEYQLDEDGEWISLMGKSEVSLYDLPYGTTYFKVRQIGYPDSAMILEINIPNHSWIKILYTLLVLGILVCGIYTFRRRLLQSVLRVLRKLNDSEDRDIPEMEKKVENDITRKEILSLEGISHEVESGTEKKILAHTDDKYRTNKVSPEECKRLYRLLDQEMKRNKPYRNPNLKVAELASLIGTTSHSLSYLFNQ